MTHTANELHKLLRIGTSRAAPGADHALPDELTALLPAAEAPGEARLWLALGALELWNRAGYVPPAPLSAPAAASACAPEALAACPARAEAALQLILQGVHAHLLAEWLRLLNARHALLPARFLPVLLDAGTRQPPLRPAIAPAIGERGRWLARLNADWSWAVSAHGAEERAHAWHTGTLEERKAALDDWRAEDPAAARAALQAVWASEPPEHRSALLPCLSAALSSDDEAFLESALDDRRKEVRLAAQRLLARLPGSALSQRMQERLAPLILLERPMLGAPRLKLTLPSERDAAMVRDGVGAGNHVGLGEKAGWLADMLAAVDPGHWTATFHMEPDACLAMAAATDFEHALLRGWILALQQRQACLAPALLSWLTALTRHWMVAQHASRMQYPAGFFGLYATLPATGEHALIARLVDASPTHSGKDDSALVDLLYQMAEASASRWPADLSRTIVERLFAGLGAISTHQWTFRPVFPSLAAVLDPATVAEFEQRWSGLRAEDAEWQNTVDKFFSIVRFRHEMALSFQEHA